MNALELLLRQPWMARLGWTLVHFLWQGTVIAVVYAAVRGMGGRLLSTRARYALACTALATMAAAPPITFLVAGDAAAGAAVRASWPVADGATWERLLPWLVVAWAAGVALFSARLIGGWRLTARMRRVAVAPAPAEWREALDALMARMWVVAPVRLLASSLASAPAVVGWLRPVILVPVEALTGMPVEQMRALLAHELAHILRRDYLVNILQSVAEAALFYHPAVWWVSEQIRAEREACCDDLAVEVTGDVLAYAKALADLDSRRRASLRLVTAADGGSLVSRIRRLLGQAEPLSHTLPGPGAVAALTLLWLAGIGAVVAHGAHSPAVAATDLARRAFVPPAAVSVQLPMAAPPRIEPMTAALLFDPFFALPQPQSTVADADKQFATVSGTVMSSSGKPIARATASLSFVTPSPASSGTTMQRLAAFSDDAGKFIFEKVPPGAYRLSVSHPAYLSSLVRRSVSGLSWQTVTVVASQGGTVGASASPSLQTLTFAAGQRVDDISVKLDEPATVSGRTVDEDGDPVARANVQVLQYLYYQGRRRLIVVASASSDDNGEFKIGRIPSGRYVVKADSRSSWAANERAPIPAAKPGQKIYNPASAYYGGSNTVVTAERIDIAAGQSIPLGEMKMANRPLLHVRGRVTGDLSMLAGARVTRILTEDGTIPWDFGADIQKDGSFDMANMFPIDEITVGVASQQGRGMVYAWTRISVRQEDLNGVVLNVAAAPMSGSLHIEGAEAAPDAPRAPMRITLTSSGAPASITATGNVNPDGSFTIPLVAAGLYTADVSGLPPGSYLKAVRLNGRESLDEGIDWRGATSGALEVTVSPKTATLDGTLLDDDGKPATGTVTLVPVPQRRGEARLYPTATADAQGRFRFQAITPGKYKVYAWEEIENTAHWDPDFVRPFESRGESIEVGEGGRATTSLKRVSAAALRDALRRAGL